MVDGLASVGIGYPEKLKCKIQKFLMDELSASVYYTKAANEMVGLGASEVSEELQKHADEEYEHFKELMEFASKHGMLKDMPVSLDCSVVDYPELSNPITVMKRVQELEQAAIADYSEMAKCAMQHGDIETAKFFKELMGDEIKHFDDLAYVNGDKRDLPDAPGGLGMVKMIIKGIKNG